MKITRAGAFVVTAASMLTLARGYTFTEENPANAPQKVSNLATNEESHIYGGSEGNIENYPFLASLRNPLLGITLCSGALITPVFIVTAAHCVAKASFVAYFGTNFSVKFDPENGALQVPIIEQYRHPLYKRKEHYYDVGVLKLARPVKRRLAKLCARDGSDNEVGILATVAGWGRTEDSILSPILEEITIPIISNAECGKFKKYTGRLTETMLCAGTGNGTDTCNGDSGSPLIVKGNILVGCVSWGGACGVQAGVFTRLANVMDYIEGVLAGDESSKLDVMPWMDLSSPDGSPKKVTPDEALSNTSPGPSSGSLNNDIMSLFGGNGSWLLEFLNSNPVLYDGASDSGKVQVKGEEAPMASQTLESTQTSIEEPLVESDKKAFKSTETVVDEPPISDSMSPPASSDSVVQSDLAQ